MKQRARIALAAMVGLTAGLGGALSTALRSSLPSELRGTRMREGSVAPVLSIPDSAMGGVITEVCARPGDPVKVGQVLVRFNAAELQQRLRELQLAELSVAAQLAGRGVLERVPERLKRYIYQTHPDVVNSEQQYVRALDAWEKLAGTRRAGEEASLAAAAQQRTLARRRLDRVLAISGDRDEMALVIRNIRKNRAELQQLLRDREVRADVNGIVDILDLKPGDKMFPKLPVATIRMDGEYSVDVILPDSGAMQVKRGQMIAGNLVNGAAIQAIVESVSRRKIAVAFREQRNVEEDTVIHLRFHSDRAIVAGLPAQFYLP